MKKMLLLLIVDILFAQEVINQERGEVWNWISNNGYLGGERCWNWWGLTWPGDSTIVNNYYTFTSHFFVGYKIDGRVYVRNHIDYFNLSSEWGEGQVLYHGPGVSEEDVIVSWHDSLTNPNVPQGEHLGITVICKSYTWSYEPWNDFIAYEFFVIWNKDQCDIPGVGNSLDSVYISLWDAFLISGADPNALYKVDDLTHFDGYVNHEWDTLGYPYDSITLLRDTFLNAPDGIYDQYIVYGDDSLEHTIHGDTLILPRNLGFAWDDDSPFEPGNDKGENGASAGYVGVALLYAPPSPADSIWIDSYGDTCRIPRVWSFRPIFKGPAALGEPIPDPACYKFMRGDSVRFPFVIYPPGSSVGLYEFLISSGPFSFSDGETLKLVFVSAVGQEMNGGYDEYYGRGWLRGLRQTIDYALTAYYAGSQHSDPYHPSGPDEDIHWGILSISEKKEKIKTLYFPSVLKSSFKFNFEKNVNLEIFDILGRKIKEMRIKKGDSPFRDIKRGIYILRSDEKRFNKKIILIK